MGGQHFVEERVTVDFIKFTMNRWGDQAQTAQHLWTRMDSNPTDRYDIIPLDSDGMCNYEGH